MQGVTGSSPVPSTKPLETLSFRGFLFIACCFGAPAGLLFFEYCKTKAGVGIGTRLHARLRESWEDSPSPCLQGYENILWHTLFYSLQSTEAGRQSELEHGTPAAEIKSRRLRLNG